MLSRRERQVMDVLYRLGEGTPEQILSELPDPPTNSAIRSTLRILCEKGHLRHSRDGRRYVYRPIQPFRRARKAALRHIVNTFFGGSSSRAAAALMEDTAELTRQEEAVLRRLIERAKREGR